MTWRWSLLLSLLLHLLVFWPEAPVPSGLGAPVEPAAVGLHASLKPLPGHLAGDVAPVRQMVQPHTPQQTRLTPSSASAVRSATE